MSTKITNEIFESYRSEQREINEAKEFLKSKGIYAKDLALITSIILNEDILGGTILQTFDRAYGIAQKFQKKFSHDFNWENQILDFDEAVILFAKEEIGKEDSDGV